MATFVYILNRGKIKVQVKGMIYNQLLWLPQQSYNNEEVGQKTAAVYQQIYANYYRDGQSVYA